MSTKLRPSELSFETICNFLEALTAIITRKDVKNKWERRARAIETFIDDVIARESGEAFEVFRLILPYLDTERGNYQLKEAALGAVYVEALGWQKNSEQAKPLLDWKNPSVLGAGDLSAIVENTVSRATNIPNEAPEEQRKRLKVGTVNAKLDEMVRAAGNRSEQSNILRSLIRQATPCQCKWLTQIILKNIKHRCGEGSLFKAWHNDAQAYYDSHGMSLRAVFNDLKDKERPASTDITPGKVVNPQLAWTTFSADIAIQKLQLYQKEKFGIDPGAVTTAGSELSFLIETKFDGERIQVHRVGNTIKYFSRAAIDHGTKNKYSQMDDAILAATGGPLSNQELEKGGAAASRFDCVLDGELIVWNTRRQNFEAFGTIKSAFHFASIGKPPDTDINIDDYEGAIDNSTTIATTATPYNLPNADSNDNGGEGTDLNNTNNGIFSTTQDVSTQKSHNARMHGGPSLLGDCELLYIPFDILYCSHGALVKNPLSDRLRVLKETVKSTSVRVPGGSGVCARVEPLLPEETRFGGVIASKKASTAEEIKSALETVRQRGEEGIVIKALNSPWIPNNRGKHWLKIKPEYLTNQEIDAVVLGGWYSTSATRSCAGITQYLMGLVKQPVREGDQPTTFITFCRVGSGLDNEQRQFVNDRLMPLFVADRKAKPSCVIAAGPASEQPDVWVKDPFKSLVFELNADLRMISSESFASRVSLRFPRIVGIRENKNAANANYEDTILLEAREKVSQATMKDAESATPGGRKRKRKSGVGHRRRRVNVVIEHARKRAEKLAAVQAESDIFKGRIIYIFPPPSGYKRDVGVKGKNVDAWRAAVKELGGKPSLNNFKSVTDVVAVTLDDPRVKKHIKSNPDKSILTPQWILNCKESNMLCPLRPRDFLYMAPDDDRRPSLEEADKFGDYYYQDTDAEDVRALIHRHIQEKEIDVDEIIKSMFAAAAPMLLLDEGKVSAGGIMKPQAVSSSSSFDATNGNSAIFANGVTSLNKLEEYTSAIKQRKFSRFSARTLLGWLDSELSAVGKLEYRRSILHGCTLFILEIPVLDGESATTPGTITGGGGKIERKKEEEANTMGFFTATKEIEAAAAGSAVAARKLRFNRLKLTAQMHGAKVVDELTPELSHFVGVITPLVIDDSGGSPSIQNSNTVGKVGIDSMATAAAAAVLSPDSDALLAALKNSGTDGSKAVQVLHDFLLHDGTIQLVNSDWIEEASVLAAAKAVEEKGGSGATTLLPQPPNAAQFPLMDAELMQDVSSWRWTHYAPVLGSSAGVEGTATGQRQEQHRRRGHFAAATGEIVHVPRTTRRGTAIQGGRANRRRDASPSQKAAPAAPPAVAAPPARTRGDAATKKKGGKKNPAHLSPLSPPSTTTAITAAAAPSIAPEASVSVPTLTGAPVIDNEVLSMRDYFNLMPMDIEKEPPLSSSTSLAAQPAVEPAATAAGASKNDSGGVKVVHDVLPSLNPEPQLPSVVAPATVSAPLRQPETAGNGASAGGAPKISLKEKIRLMKEAKEKMQQAG